MDRALAIYPGGKWKQRKWIVEQFPQHSAYIEPFGGALSVLFEKPRCPVETINDIDDDIINIYRVVRHPEKMLELERRLEYTPYAESEYKSLQSMKPEDGDDIEWARRAIVLMRMVIVKQRWREKASMRTGGNANIIYEHIREWHKRLRGVVIMQMDAVTMLEKLSSFSGNTKGDKTLVYLDPPYPDTTQSGYTADADHEKMAKVLHDLDAMVAVSGYHGSYDDFYGEWEYVEKNAFAGTGAKEGSVGRTEVLWMNPALMSRRGAQYDFFGD